MVALLHPRTRSSSGALPPAATPAKGPGLRLIVDNKDGQAGGDGPAASLRRATGVTRFARAAPATRPATDDQGQWSTALVVAAVALVVFGGLFLLRWSQGSPVVDGPGQVRSVTGVAGAVAAPGDRVVVAKPGDSFWSIAESLAPGADPRPAVSTLIEANGSETLQIGQQIVIPQELLD